MARIRKNENIPPPYLKKIKNKEGGVICAPSAKHGIVPKFWGVSYKSYKLNKFRK